LFNEKLILQDNIGIKLAGKSFFSAKFFHNFIINSNIKWSNLTSYPRKENGTLLMQDSFKSILLRHVWDYGCGCGSKCFLFRNTSK
jgi:hypothetical protein